MGALAVVAVTGGVGGSGAFSINFTALCVDGIDGTEQAVDLGLVVGAEVAAGAVMNAQDDVAVAGIVGAVVFGVVEQKSSDCFVDARLPTHLVALREIGSDLPWVHQLCVDS
jgi:hypothetical protein